VKAFRILALLAIAASSGCDLPTSLPEWSTSWEIVAAEKDVGIADLLPRDVRIDPRGFAIDSFSVTSSIVLGDVCEMCTCFDGPIPELEFSEHEWPMRLPSGLSEAQMLQGRARLVMTNHIGFDPLDDGLGGHGRIDVVLVDRNTREEVDRAEITGSWPVGDSVALEFDLAGRRLHSSLVAEVSGRTPGSGECDVDLTEESGFEARVELRDVIASSVSVSVRESALALDPRSLTLPSELASRLRPGDARVAVEVEMTSRVPTSAEIDLSVAPDAAALFTGAASLHTPLVLPGGTLAAPADARAVYLLDLTGVTGSRQLYFAARTRITGGRVARLTGPESLRYRLIVRAEVPSR
jgi:hypothetical protein